MDNSSQKKTSLKTQGAWILFAKITGFVISFLLPLLIVRFLTQDKVGVYRQAFQVITNAVAILPLGFSMSAYYFLSRGVERRKSAILNILLFNFVVGGLVCAGLNFYPQFLGNIYQSDEMTMLAPKIGVVIWLWIFSTFLEVVAIANNEARIATVFIILAQLTKTGLMAGAVVLFASVEAFMYAAMIQAVFQIAILLFYLNLRFPRFWLEFDWHFFREQAFYAMPYGLAGVLWTLQTDIHTYFVGYRFSEAEYAIYAYGCFQLPLLSMLVESTSVILIARMSELQARDAKREIVTLTARAMQKLSFFYFPAYVFLLITASVFITTLFTDNFAASVPIFLINLTLLPFDIWVIDPITRAYKEFGRFLIILRVFTVIGLVTVLWFGIQHFSLTGMIATVVITSLIERFISTTVLLRILDVKWQDWRLLKDVGKTAVISAAAGIITFFVYRQAREIMPVVGNNLAQMIFSAPKKGLVDFISGSLTLGVSLAVFAPVYLFLMNRFNLIDDDEKNLIKNLPGKFSGKFRMASQIS
ncbi:MAG: lipopolysaccharide biosynthesis protein [Pyrinomonadaceae bacterium]